MMDSVSKSNCQPQLRRVENLSKRKLLAQRTQVARTFATRLRGLLFRSPLAPGEGLLICPCNSVHTFLMGYPIDVVFINREKRVVHLIKEMQPQRISRLVRKAHSVLELPAGAVAESGTEVGDLLCFH